jgi:regulator of protease activity HflC (stomatin/prohibitin superfamily)
MLTTLGMVAFAAALAAAAAVLAALVFWTCGCLVVVPEDHLAVVETRCTRRYRRTLRAGLNAVFWDTLREVRWRFTNTDFDSRRTATHTVATAVLRTTFAIDPPPYDALLRDGAAVRLDARLDVAIVDAERALSATRGDLPTLVRQQFAVVACAVLAPVAASGAMPSQAALNTALNDAFRWWAERIGVAIHVGLQELRVAPPGTVEAEARAADSLGAAGQALMRARVTPWLSSTTLPPLATGVHKPTA